MFFLFTVYRFLINTLPRGYGIVFESKAFEPLVHEFVIDLSKRIAFDKSETERGFCNVSISHEIICDFVEEASKVLGILSPGSSIGIVKRQALHFDMAKMMDGYGIMQITS